MPTKVVSDLLWLILPGREVEVHGAPDVGIDQLTSSILPQISTTDPSLSRPGAISQVTYYYMEWRVRYTQSQHTR